MRVATKVLKGCGTTMPTQKKSHDRRVVNLLSSWSNLPQPKSHQSESKEQIYLKVIKSKFRRDCIKMYKDEIQYF